MQTNRTGTVNATLQNSQTTEGAAPRWNKRLVFNASTAICGVMMLGGGFGRMSTAAPSLNDGEFGRLRDAVNIASVCKDRTETTRESLAAEHRSDVPAGSSSEQGDAYKI